MLPELHGILTVAYYSVTVGVSAFKTPQWTVDGLFPPDLHMADASALPAILLNGTVTVSISKRCEECPEHVQLGSKKKMG